MNRHTIKQGLDEIASNDKDVAKALEQIGYPKPRIRPTGFETLFSIIVAQQISTYAAAAVLERARALLPDLDAKSVEALPKGALREAGLSQRKVIYVEGLSKAILSGAFDLDELLHLDDQSAVHKIVALKGLGTWSAKIYLMFSLQRQDIFPSGDTALLTSLQHLKSLKNKPTIKEAEGMLAPWTPWRSIGSLFLWHYHHQFIRINERADSKTHRNS